MTNYLGTNVIWIVMKHEYTDSFEGPMLNDEKHMPDKAFERLEDACNYIMEQEPTVLDCWRKVGDEFDHRYDAGIERRISYEGTHNGHTFCKDIYYDVLPEELIKGV